MIQNGILNKSIEYSITNAREQLVKNLHGTWTALLLFFCFFNPALALEQGEKPFKTFQDRDFRFEWKYDFSTDGYIVVRGMMENIDGFKFESVVLTITALDAEGNRLDAGFSPVHDLEIGEFEEFEIAIPKEGPEKSFLFTYDFEFYLEGSAAIASPSGPESMTGWFEDSPDPSFVPRMVSNPPPYRKKKKP